MSEIYEKKNLKEWYKAYIEGELSTSTMTAQRWQYMQNFVKQEILNKKIKKVKNT